MPGQYQIKLRNHSGVVQEVITAWESEGTGFSYTKALDGIGSYTLDLPTWNNQYQSFHKDYFVEVLRKDPPRIMDWYTDGVFLHRNKGFVIHNGNQLYRTQGPDLTDLIKRKRILYPTQDPLASQFGASDDCMKRWVEQNAGPSATSPPRMKDGVFPNFQVAAETSLGPLWSGARQFSNVFDVVHEIALATLTDFDVVIVSWAPLVIEFRTYYPYLGLDRTQYNGVNPPAVFSPEMGNMGNPEYAENSSSEITSVIVLGQGQLAERDFILAQSAAITDSPWNDIEITMSQVQDDLQTSLDAVGAAELQRRQTKQDFRFDTLENENLCYGRDYDVGDKVTALFNFGDPPIDRRITGITVTMRGPEESVAPTFSDIT